MMEEYSSETSVGFQPAKQHHIPEDRTFHNHRRENLRSYIVIYRMPVLKVSGAPAASSFRVSKERAAFHVRVSEEPADYIVTISEETAASILRGI
jgi:hypothetical protein